MERIRSRRCLSAQNNYLLDGIDNVMRSQCPGWIRARTSRYAIFTMRLRLRRRPSGKQIYRRSVEGNVKSTDLLIVG